MLILLPFVLFSGASALFAMLNSSATLFLLGVYKRVINPEATTAQVVKSGRWCSAVVAVAAAIGAPVIFMGQDGIFGFFQKLNGGYAVPLFAAILVGMCNRRVSGKSAVIAMVTPLLIMLWNTFFAVGSSARSSAPAIISWGRFSCF